MGRRRGRGVGAIWRRLVRRIRSGWRWVILRTVRDWLAGARGGTRPDLGHVREFPHRELH